MPAYIFDTILTKGVRAGQIPARTTDARNWFRKEAEKTSTAPSSLIKSMKDRTSGFEYGNMYLFQYDPKHKSTLPYYDTFPLVFPVKNAPKGFMGLNMHYLPLKQRAMLMDALYSLVTDKKYDEGTKLKLSYDVLNASSRFKYFKPCLKHYLNGHVKSRKIKIESVEWDMALFMPLQRFKKASAAKVYRDSLQAV